MARSWSTRLPSSLYLSSPHFLPPSFYSSRPFALAQAQKDVVHEANKEGRWNPNKLPSCSRAGFTYLGVFSGYLSIPGVYVATSGSGKHLSHSMLAYVQ